MSTTAQINDSLKLGGAMLREIGRVGKLHKPGVEQAGFAVLKAPDIPSVLVEAAFISNPEEEAKLNSEAYQEAAGRCADARHTGLFRPQSAAGAQPDGLADRSVGTGSSRLACGLSPVSIAASDHFTLGKCQKCL